MSSKNHWESVYGTKNADSVSWYQPHSTMSLELIGASCSTECCAVIDVGGGASTLVDDLLVRGYSNLTVLDISGEALQVAQARLGDLAKKVHWLEGDITATQLPKHAYDVWHDRAVFHFLTDPADRLAYVDLVMHAVKPGGHVIVATFGVDGPERCSGLPVVRYSPDELHGEFGPHFAMVEHLEERHMTPAGNPQDFIYCHCLKYG